MADRVTKVVEKVVRPGQQLPQGRLISAWKLTDKHMAEVYGKGAICIQYEPES